MTIFFKNIAILLLTGKRTSGSEPAAAVGPARRAHQQHAGRARLLQRRGPQPHHQPLRPLAATALHRALGTRRTTPPGAAATHYKQCLVTYASG